VKVSRVFSTESADIPLRTALVIVGVVAAVVFSNALGNGFALDDVAIIQKNARVHDLFNQGSIWLTPYWPTYGRELGLYRPFAIFAFAVQWAIGGGHAWLFHAVSVALHIGMSILLFSLLDVLTSSRAAALAGAVVFAVHPVHVEAVANTVGQAELIAGCCILAALLMAATRPAGAAVSFARLLGISVLLLVGMLTKESAIVLPPLLLALDIAQGRVRAAGGVGAYARAVALPVLALAAICAGVVALRTSVLGSLSSDYIAPGLPFLRGDHRVLVGLSVVPEFLRLLFFPLDLSADYAPAVIEPVTRVTVMVIAGTVLLLGAVALALRTPRSLAGLAAAWFVLTILPISNLLFPIGVVLAERLLYLPSVALAFIAAFAWLNLPEQRFRKAYVLVALVVLLGARSLVRNRDWRNDDAVTAALVRDHPESYRAQFVVGNALLASDPAKARSYYEMAYKTWPNDPFLLSQIGRLAIAERDFARGVKLLEQARELAPYVHETESSLAYGYIGLGQPREALRALDRAEELHAEPRTLLPLRALAHETSGQLDSANVAWRSVAHEFGDAIYWELLARSLARSDQAGAALAALDSARTGARPEELNTILMLEQAVRTGCYASTARAASRCVEPVLNAHITLPGQSNQRAAGKQ
jgi:protein O-mannosyl-transferase